MEFVSSVCAWPRIVSGGYSAPGAAGGFDAAWRLGAMRNVLPIYL
ncbi:hypothetical protein ACFWP0_23995 [Achromobacter sp. NPDC058515]